MAEIYDATTDSVIVYCDVCGQELTEEEQAACEGAPLDLCFMCAVENFAES